MATKSASGRDGALESSAKGCPASALDGWNRYKGQYPERTASFWWVIDFDMSIPWAMQVEYAITSEGPG